MRNWRFNTIRKLNQKISILIGQKKEAKSILQEQLLTDEIKSCEDRKTELKNELSYMEGLGVNDQ